MVGTFLLNLYYWPVFILFTLVSLLVLPLILVVFHLLLRQSLGSVIRRSIVIYGWVLVKLVPFFGPVSVIGEYKKLPQPVVFVANHNSAIDPYLFGAIVLENSFVTSWPFSIPVYNVIMKMAGYVDSTRGWEEIKEQCLNLLHSGSSVTIWPEGHRSRGGELGRFKNGAFQLAVESERPVVPVLILGSAKVLPPGSCWLRPGRVRLQLLEPVYPEQTVDKNYAVLSLKKRVKECIEEGLLAQGHFRDFPQAERNYHDS